MTDCPFRKYRFFTRKSPDSQPHDANLSSMLKEQAIVTKRPKCRLMSLIIKHLPYQGKYRAKLGSEFFPRPRRNPSENPLRESLGPLGQDFSEGIPSHANPSDWHAWNLWKSLFAPLNDLQTTTSPTTFFLDFFINKKPRLGVALSLNFFLNPC